MNPSAPTPEGAMRVGNWEEYSGTGGTQSRSVVWAEYNDGAVVVDGRQWRDGTFDAAVTLYLSDGEQLDAPQARQLAAALLDAADRLGTVDGPARDAAFPDQ